MVFATSPAYLGMMFGAKQSRRQRPDVLAGAAWDAGDLAGVVSLMPRAVTRRLAGALSCEADAGEIAAALARRTGAAGGAALALARAAQTAADGGEPAGLIAADAWQRTRPEPAAGDVIALAAWHAARVRRMLARAEGGAPPAAVFAASGQNAPGDLWETALADARRELGRFNIIVAGRTGVGKTTLIGAVFGQALGDTRAGRPRTRGRVWYPEVPGEGDVLRLCDTEGLEAARYAETLRGLEAEIAAGAASPDPFARIHIAWLCIDEPSATVEPAEEALAQMFARVGLPFIAVLTKAGMAPDFAGVVRGLIPGAAEVVRVRAQALEIEDHAFPPMGLDTLRAATAALIPDAVRGAFAVAARDLPAMVARARATVATAAAAAGAAGATPIPLADAAALFAIQTAMLIRISTQMGVRLERRDARLLAASVIGTGGASLGGRFIVGQLAKIIPGIGTLAGAAITASAASAATYALGRAYVGWLERQAQAGAMPSAAEIAERFGRLWRSGGTATQREPDSKK